MAKVSISKNYSFLREIKKTEFMFKLEQRSALAISLSIFLWIILMFLTGFHDQHIKYQGLMGLISFAFPAIGIWWALIYKRDKQFSGNITFVQAFMSGILISIFTSVVSVLLMWLYITIINPSFFRAQIEYERQRILTQVAEEQQPNYISEVAEHFTSFNFLLSNFVISTVVCLFISLILAILIKKHKENQSTA